MRKDTHGHIIVDNLDQVDEYIKGRNEASEKEKLYKEDIYEVRNGEVHVDHLKTAKVLIEFIKQTPKMDSWIKKIMIMRIERPAINGQKMSHLAIALELGMKEEEVRELEKVGIMICEEWLKRVTMLDSEGKAVDKIII